MTVKKRRFDLKKTLFLLPNMITLSSIFCGFDAIRLLSEAKTAEVLVAEGKPPTDVDTFYRAAILLVFALLFDMLDGRVARLTKTQSAFGLQIDSLADVISFGVAPALLVYKWSLHQLPSPIGVVGAFVFAGAGAVRLARFNVLSMGESGAPTKPGKYIVGLPVPGAAGILISLIIANSATGGALGAPGYAWVIFGLTLFLAFLQVSTIKFRSFKDLRMNARGIALVVFAVGSSAVVSYFKGPAFVLCWLLSFYVGIGLVELVVTYPKRRREKRAEREAAAATAARGSVPSHPPVP